LRRPLLVFWSLFILQLLAACGNSAGTALPPSGRATTAALPAPSMPTARPATALPAPQPSAALAAPTAEAAIPEGVTAEGYHMLGRPDAPVTLTMYSDFL